MANVIKHGVLIESISKGNWRVVTRSCNSYRYLKVGADRVDLKTAENLAAGVRQGAERRRAANF